MRRGRAIYAFLIPGMAQYIWQHYNNLILSFLFLSQHSTLWRTQLSHMSLHLASYAGFWQNCHFPYNTMHFGLEFIIKEIKFV